MDHFVYILDNHGLCLWSHDFINLDQNTNADLVLLLLLYKPRGPAELKEYLLLIGVEWRLKNMLCFFGSVMKKLNKKNNEINDVKNTIKSDIYF